MAASPWASIAVMAPRRRRRRRGKDYRNPSLVKHFLVFLSVSVLSLLILDQERIWPVAHILARSESVAPTVLSETESIPAGGEGGSEGSRPAPPPLSPSLQAEESCNDARVLVDRSHPLPLDYAPEDLVSLRDYRISTLDSSEMRLRSEAAERLRELVSAAAADGEELIVASSYRSYKDQEVSHDRLSSVYGSDANRVSARPGHSQHQLGTAVDFTNAAASYEVGERFGHTSAYRWLLSNAYEHGFILAYPEDNEAETGYQWEPWHYRYVGVGNAEQIAEGGMSLQEFLVREGVVPHC